MPPHESSCGICRHFDSDPEAFARAFPGVTVLRSTGATRSYEGYCRLHCKLTPPNAACDDFALRRPPEGSSPTQKG
jgi:hypothetical protein